MNLAKLAANAKDYNSLQVAQVEQGQMIEHLSGREIFKALSRKTTWVDGIKTYCIAQVSDQVADGSEVGRAAVEAQTQPD